jgi:hypothetical protein
MPSLEIMDHHHGGNIAINSFLKHRMGTAITWMTWTQICVNVNIHNPSVGRILNY